jgi:penicillin-binding protein 1C
VKALPLRPIHRALLGLALAPVFAILVAAVLTPLPAALRPAAQDAPSSVRVLDRDGRLLREVRTDGGGWSAKVALRELPAEVPAAMLAAEDARFRLHPGVDPIAVVRAGLQALYHRRIVSGASTITQQLARNVVYRPRSLRGKLSEMALALRIEASLGKDEILEEYLNRVEFGSNIRGIEAASRHYFDKPAAKLSLGEAATLAAIPRGPALYDPRRGTDNVLKRRDRILERMRNRGLASDEAIDHAKSQPVTLQRRSVEGGAYHFVRGIAANKLVPELTGQGAQEIVTTLDSGLQREVETLAAAAKERFLRYDASAAAVIVVENGSGEVLAYVGSPDYFDADALGQNDGVTALRQPGSTLKPFVYAEAMSQLGMTPATILPDVELHLSTAEGDYSPRNYDGRFHGPVRLRDALANSLNVPAVYVASELGPARALAGLRRVGFRSLDKDPAHYGAAIALGDGEVTLAELAQAYSTIARGGNARRLGFVRTAKIGGGGEIVLPRAAEERVLDARTAAQLADILSDEKARISAFGRGNVLELPFPVAAKTGTSKGFRDNWTVGFTREVTVAVWVGNFDGRPMTGSSGVTGAAPLFREVMLAAMRGKTPAPLVDGTAGLLEEADVCALSGKRPGPRCTHRIHERFAPGHVPQQSCDLHVEVEIDGRNGLLAGPSCARGETHVFESYPDRYASWASQAGRPIAPTEFSPLCPGRADASGKKPRVAYPFDGARFAVDPSMHREQQAIVLAAHVPPGTRRVRFRVDGRALPEVVAPYRTPLALTRGTHAVSVETEGGLSSPSVRFYVD